MAYATTNPYTWGSREDLPGRDGRRSQAGDREGAPRLPGLEGNGLRSTRRILQKAANILRRDADSYAKRLTLEMGKLFSKAKLEVELSAKIFEYYVRNAERLLQPERCPFSIRPRARRPSSMNRSACRWPSSRGTFRLPDRPHPRTAALRW